MAVYKACIKKLIKFINIIFKKNNKLFKILNNYFRKNKIIEYNRGMS